MLYPAITRVILDSFRNYSTLDIKVGNTSVLITGDNGAGKTNLLEALSLLTVGKGMRHAAFADMEHHNAPWTIAGHIDNGNISHMVATKHIYTPQSSKRQIFIDGEKQSSQESLLEYLQLVWLTPQMDHMFIGATNTRRKFMDQLVGNFDSEHTKRLYRSEHAMRQRLKILEQKGGDPEWLTIIEASIAELAIAIASSRIDILIKIDHEIANSPSVFPQASLSVDGIIETKLKEMSALEVEDWYKTELAQNRNIDRSKGRTSVGVHKSDFRVLHQEKKLPAALCSTGEQKSLLVAIILGKAKALKRWCKQTPILLLDEIIAHFDEVRKVALLDEIQQLDMQCWMTATDIDVFDIAKHEIMHLKVEEGELTS